MSTQVVYVCDDEDEAATAHQVLIRQGFLAPNIATNLVDIFVYDAKSFGDGQTDAASGKWIVIGRK